MPNARIFSRIKTILTYQPILNFSNLAVQPSFFKCFNTVHVAERCYRILSVQDPLLQLNRMRNNFFPC